MIKRILVITGPGKFQKLENCYGKHTSHVPTSDIFKVMISLVPFFWSFIDLMAGSSQELVI